MNIQYFQPGKLLQKHCQGNMKVAHFKLLLAIWTLKHTFDVTLRSVNKEICLLTERREAFHHIKNRLHNLKDNIGALTVSAKRASLFHSLILIIPQFI